MMVNRAPGVFHLIFVLPSQDLPRTLPICLMSIPYHQPGNFPTTVVRVSPNKTLGRQSGISGHMGCNTNRLTPTGDMRAGRLPYLRIISYPSSVVGGLARIYLKSTPSHPRITDHWVQYVLGHTSLPGRPRKSSRSPFCRPQLWKG